ncbi:kinetochore protein Mis14 [Schizosaccharomyces cryophilus OY26]|uniref:Kinetochore protein Mis14 n=1 Tax=Schizosaccharomyces cryophilus (strain OY26 / ATCC MYA-4695 / CBS 11777 / NBRC 106824 / NRRL Y48691) TaxID=653667 RepID=S9W4D6_SCHCR|nr:kinetochore protein Mis14 [Schizosaccharomyces cryophilus OY26]EPY53364.1 kinetochore protein Mis14 [Schizosaccharomyces cryophilus OY26]
MASNDDDSSLPKVMLDSIQDYSYVKSVFRHAVQKNLEIHLPEQASRETGKGKEDHLRVRVKEMLNELIESTFMTVQDNIMINGFDAKTALQDPKNSDQIEPFDLALRSKVQQLFNDVEDAQVRVAKYRKYVPVQYESAFSNSLNEQLTALQKIKDSPTVDESNPVNDFQENDGPPIDVDRYEQTIAKIAFLKKNIPKVTAQLEKTL